jgi:predicted solute-binding protein
MTVKLNLTIDEKIVAKSKRYAAKKKTTVSKMVQEFLRKQVEQEEKKTKEKSFVEKWAGTFSGKLSDERVKKIKDEYFSKKYGY